MSREVDQRVVEMRFDNAEFEKNTKQSIRTIDRLMEKLQFKGAEKGFEKLDAAAKDVDFDTMARSLDSLEGKFSAFNIMATTALVNITNKMVDAGEKMVKSLSIDQVTAGWNKYAQKTASVQTIMNATGKSITKVNGYLEKLMWFSDETSYGFTDMTAALSTLTSAGGDIEKMIPMIMGMANVTAYAGKGAAEFQRVIYNLAQSYGTGAIQLIDWKSVEQAGVASQQLKQMIIDTAVSLGKIKKGEVTTGSFDNSLQKKWADTEVMEAAFGKFAEFSEAVKKRVDANPGMLASQAIEDLADQYDEVTVKAFKAAQEAKSFSEAVDATKDAVSSGWMETFDILFGNYEEAKGFWSDLAEEFWNMFAGGAAGRNHWLKSAFSSGLDQLLDTEGFTDAADSYTNLLQKALVKQGLLSEEGIADAGSFQKALEESGVTAGQLYDVIGGAAAKYASLNALSDAELKKKDLDRDKVKTLAAAYADMAAKIQNGSVNLGEFADKMNTLSGREHFFAGILNILEGINSVLGPIREAFGEVFMVDGSPLYNLLKGFDAATGKLRLSEETGKQLKAVFNGVFSVASIGLKGAKAALSVVLTLVSRLLELLSPLGNLLGSIGGHIGDVLAWVNEALGQAEDLGDVIGILAGGFAALVQPIREVWQGIKTLVRGGDMDTAKQQFSAFRVVVNAVSGVLENFKMGSVSAGGVIGKAMTVLGGIITAAFGGVGSLIASAFNGFRDAGKRIEDFKETHVPLLETIRDAVLSLPEKATAALENFAGAISWGMESISDACRDALDAIVAFFHLEDGLDLYRLLGLVDVGAVALAIWGASKLLNDASKKLKDTLANPIGNFFDSLSSAVNTWTKANTTNNLAIAAKGIATAVGIISASVFLLAQIKDPTQALQALGEVIAALFGMVIALKVLAATDITGLDTAKLFGTIAAISVGMTALSAAFVKMGSLHTYQVENALAAISRIASVLMSTVGMLTIFNTYGDGVKGAGSFVAAAAAIDMIALALIPLAKAKENGLDIDGAVEAINGIAIAMSVLMVAAGFAQKLAGKTDVKALEKIGTWLVKLGGLVVALNGIGSALLMTAGAVAVFAALGDKVWTGLGAAAVALLEITGTLAALSGSKLNPLRMKKMAASLVVASSALVVLGAAVKTMNDAVAADTTEGAGLAVLTVGLIALAGAVYFLGKNATESMGGAAALVAMGAALVEMAWAIKMLEEVSLAGLAKGIITMAAALGILAAGIGWLSASAAGIVSLAGACLMLATALLILTPAFQGLASLTAGEALAGLIGTVAMMFGLFAVGSITPVASGMVIISACMISLAKAFSAFAGGLVKLSIAAAILTVLAAFAGPIREVIESSAGDIEAALTAVITGICNTIVNCAEPIAQALFSLAVALTEAVVYYLAWFFGAVDVSAQSGMDMVWNDLTEWFENHSLIDLFKAWVAEAADALKNWNPFDIFTVDMDGTAGKAGDAVGRFVDKIDEIFGTGIKNYFRKWAGMELIPVEELEKQGLTVEQYEKQLKESEEAASEADTANKNLTDKIDETTEKTGNQTVALKKNTEGLYELTTETGEVRYADEQWLRATLNGTDAMGDASTAMADGAQVIADAAGASASAAGVVQTNSAAVESGIRTIGTKTGEVTKTVETVMNDGVEPAQDTAEEGGKGIAGKLFDGISSKLQELFPDFSSKLQGWVNDAVGNVSVPQIGTSGMPDFESWYENEISKYRTKPLGGDKSGLTDEDYEDEVQIDPTNPKTSTGSTTKKSGTQKTVAQQITEKYKTQLEANKALRDAMDSEYELWLTENQYSASEDELLAKKTENAAAEIANQTERVAIAEAKYSEFVKKWGADKTETKQAYASLLSEKTSLAKLKTEQYTNLFEAVTKRYDTDLDTLEAQYNLWTAQNDGTASELDKIRRETEYQTAELEIKQKKEAKAKEQYDTLFAQYGENDLRTKEALNDWLDAQTESLELQNDIAKQGLKEMNARISAIKTAQSRMENRMDLLNTLYEDGSISDRADAYKQAVETYGENSAEAQKAQFQGITTAILGTVSAMQGMTAEMEKYAERAQQLEKMNPNDENYDDVYSQWQDAQKSMVSYAGNLADALGLDANGKKTVMRLARILQKNSSYIESACKTIWDRISEALGPTVSETFTSVFKAMSTEDGMEIGTEFISAFASALQGDWAGAVVSALGGVLDLMNTESGQQITAGIAQLFSTALPQIQNGLGGVDKLLNGQGGLASMFGTAMTGIQAAVEGGGGIATVLNGIGTALSGLGASLMAILPEILPFILIFAALAAVVGGLAWFIGSRKKSQKDTVISVKEAGADLDRDYADGIKDRADIVDDAVEEVTEDAWETARSALSTILKKNGDEYDYQPEITPVIDLSDAESAVDWLHANLTDEDSAVQVDFGRSAELAADMMNSLDVKRDAMLKAEESYQKQLSNDDVVTAVSGLGERMDGVAKAIKGMKLTVDGRRAIGYIDEAMGKRTAAIVR